jgi:hypothetical protein
MGAEIGFSEIASMPALSSRLAPQANDPSQGLGLTGPLTGAGPLARMQLATAAATWCNAYDVGF